MKGTAPLTQRMRLGYAGGCRFCQTVLPAGTKAIYEPATRQPCTASCPVASRAATTASAVDGPPCAQASLVGHCNPGRIEAGSAELISQLRGSPRRRQLSAPIRAPEINHTHLGVLVLLINLARLLSVSVL